MWTYLLCIPVSCWVFFSRSRMYFVHNHFISSLSCMVLGILFELRFVSVCDVNSVGQVYRSSILSRLKNKQQQPLVNLIICLVSSALWLKIKLHCLDWIFCDCLRIRTQTHERLKTTLFIMHQDLQEERRKHFNMTQVLNRDCFIVLNNVRLSFTNLNCSHCAKNEVQVVYPILYKKFVYNLNVLML